MESDNVTDPRTGSELDHLIRIEKFMASMTDLNSLLIVIMRETTLATDAESCSIALYDEKTNELRFSVARGEDEERDFERALKLIRVPMGTGVIGWCAEHREPMNIHDAYSDDRFNRDTDRRTGFKTKTILAVPMIKRGKLIGVVEAVNKRGDGSFDERDEQVLTVLAAQAAMSIDNARLLEENLRQAQFSALGQGIAGAAHCIKNILNGIVGGGYVLEVGYKREDEGKVDEGWEILKRNTSVMKDLVLDLLSYSKPENPHYEPADVNVVCRDVVNLMKHGAAEKGIELSLDLDGGIGPVMVDPKGMYRCVLNLVTNAVDACSGEQKGEVKITTASDEDSDRFYISVSDNGSGIQPEYRQKLFDVFFSTKGANGTGLGLAVTKKIVEEHSGMVTVESSLGSGTTFTMALPITPPAEAILTP